MRVSSFERFAVCIAARLTTDDDDDDDDDDDACERMFRVVYRM